MTKLTVWFYSKNAVVASLYCPEKRISLEFNPDEFSENANQFEMFKREFQLIWQYRENICNTPELSNIQIPEVGTSYAYTSCGPVTLGMLLNLYAQGKLRVGHCKNCGHETLGYYFCGSILSGSGSHLGFCPVCGQDEYYKDHGYVHKLLFEYKHPFPVESTQWTVTTLVSSLKKVKLNISEY